MPNARPNHPESAESGQTVGDEQEIIRTAKAKSNEMVAAAENKSADLRRVANEYADECVEGRKEPYRKRWTKCASRECASQRIGVFRPRGEQKGDAQSEY
jgi:hypothetical protein